MNADYGLIGKQISFYRHQVGLTQEQLAEACNLSVSYLNRIENGLTQLMQDYDYSSFFDASQEYVLTDN